MCVSDQVLVHLVAGLPHVLVEGEHGGVQVHALELLSRALALTEVPVVSLHVDAGIAFRQLAHAGPVEEDSHLLGKGKIIAAAQHVSLPVLPHTEQDRVVAHAALEVAEAVQLFDLRDGQHNCHQAALQQVLLEALRRRVAAAEEPLLEGVEHAVD